MRFDHPQGFLSRLARDVRGNTLAIMAAALVPLMGFAGSAVDFARIYTVKVRLQQACDAGVLAGRKAMTDTSLSTPLDSTAATQANTFFANNFAAQYNSSTGAFTGGWYKTSNINFVPSKTADAGSTVANTVQATASVTLPMAVMSFFGINTRDLVATCQARFDLADTDVMFVLDTTGSMSCTPSAAASCANGVISYTRSDGSTGYHNQESSGSKIEALRQAVVLFDSTMRANADPTTHFRYGFVTYTSSVNVGGIIPSQYIQSGNYTYQSRHLSPTSNGSYTNSTGDYNYGVSSLFSYSGIPQIYCVPQRLPAAGFLRTGPLIGSNPAWADAGYYQARYIYNTSWTSTNGGTCTGTQQPLRAMWRYEPVSVDISQFAAGQTVTVPGRLDGLTSKWRGCIEEVDSTSSTSFSLGSLPDDLNPDFKPMSATDKWRPIWPEVEWLRGDLTNAVDRKDEEINEDVVNQWEDYSYRAGKSLDQSGSVPCGMPAKRLKVWTAQEVHDYVYDTDFQPFGGTYHDVGMIWGTRMLSPDSVFGDSTAWPGRNEPTRNIVFMTDGNMAPSLTSYGQYGVEYWDKRVTAADYSSQTDRHNARFRIECDAAKKKGFTIYVVAVGVAVNSDLTYCASPGQTFQASSTSALTDAFKSIAQRIAMLRITQ